MRLREHVAQQRSGSRRFAPLLAFLGLLLAAAGGLASPAAAQLATGRVAGKVISTQTGEPVASAQVYVEGTTIGSLTDASGRYVLSAVPVGTHSISVRTLGYGAKTVTDVEVAENEVSTLDISLAPEAVALKGVTVSAEREMGATSTLLSARRRAPVVLDAIGAEQISRSPDGDAASALRRVPGASVVDGKFVYIRGLGERYGATTLNGAPLPSPLPDRKAVPLDVIPSNLLESVVASKTYLPSQPGDQAGGMVQIQTRTVPTSRTLRLSTSVGYSSLSSLEPAYTTGDGAGLFGLGGSSRGLPTSLLNGGTMALPDDPGARQALARSLTRGFSLREQNAPLDQSIGLAFGDEILIGGSPIGVVGSFSLSSSYSAPQDQAERYFVLDAGAPATDFDFDITSGLHETSLGALLGASFEIAPAQRITASGTYTRLTEDLSRTLAGYFHGGSDYVETYQTRYLANSIANFQLRGEHLVSGLGDVTAEWRASYGRARRDEPGTRTAAYQGSGPASEVYFLSTSSSGLIFGQSLDENLFSAAVDLKKPFSLRSLPATLSFGVSADARDRGVDTRRILLDPNGGLPGDVAALPPDELFVPGRIGAEFGQFEVRDRTFPEDNYTADEIVIAGYLMLDGEVLPRLRAVAGARVEVTRQTVAPVSAVARGSGAALENVDLLPALNLTYAFRDGMNLRAAVSRTIARPQFRELAPFLYADYFAGIPTRGNPHLERSSIINTDARWEWFPTSGAVISAGAFHKRFTDPIEPVVIPLGTNPGRTYANTDGATVYGVEFEARSSLGLISDALDDVSVNANLTLAESDVEADSVLIYDASRPAIPLVYTVGEQGGRPLFGQSPYVINLGITYFQPRTGTTGTVLFNRFGRRLDALGGRFLPNTYEEARSQLDITVEQAVTSGLALKLSASRLLGGEVLFTQTFPDGQTVRTREYDLGRTYSLSLSWEPWGGR